MVRTEVQPSSPPRISAYVNADPGTGEALFGAALADGQLPACLVALAGSTVATLQRRA